MIRVSLQHFIQHQTEETVEEEVPTTGVETLTVDLNLETITEETLMEDPHLELHSEED